MADDGIPRATSRAKSLDGLQQDENALDRARNLQQAFLEAKARLERAPEIQKPQPAPEKSGSEMVRKDRPQQELKPGGPGSKRLAHNIDLAKEHAREDAKLQEAQRLKTVFHAHAKAPGHDREDRER